MKWLSSAAILAMIGMILCAPAWAKGEDAPPNVAIERLEKMAKKGSAQAQSQLGSLYFEGKMGAKRDYSLAVYWFEKSAAQGYANGQFNLALSYEEGTGIERDRDQALELYEKAADQGLLQAQINAAIILNSKRLYEEGNRYLRMGALKGNYFCQREFARNLLSGRGTDRNAEYALAFLKAAAEGGDAEAQLLLADSYSGMYPTIPRDIQKMIDNLWAAASAGVPEAQSKMGFCYEKGIGVEKDTETAVKWYTQAAEQDYAHAMVNLGHAYGEGRGLPRDDRKAYQWYKKAADTGNPVGFYNVGVCYAYGRGCANNDRLSTYNFQEAAKLGYSKAQYNLGVAYEEGRGIEENPTMAFFNYKQAALQDDTAATTALGYCYFRGYGVKRDLAQARKYFSSAAATGDDEAQHALQTLPGLPKGGPPTITPPKQTDNGIFESVPFDPKRR